MNYNNIGISHTLYSNSYNGSIRIVNSLPQILNLDCIFSTVETNNLSRLEENVNNEDSTSTSSWDMDIESVCNSDY